MTFLHIDSPENAKIKQASTLFKDKSARIKEQSAVIENGVMLEEALSCGIKIKQVFCKADRLDKYAKILSDCRDNGAEIYTVSDRAMKKLTNLEVPQGISAIMDLNSLKKLKIKQNGRYIVCERMADPGNLGTVIRTADAMGFDGVILTRGSVEAFSPKVMRATMGSVFRLPIMSEADIGTVTAELKSSGVLTLAAVLNSKAAPADSFVSKNGVAVLIGNEASGLSDEAIASADASTYIPMSGKAESLNAAVAAAIFMWIFRN